MLNSRTAKLYILGNKIQETASLFSFSQVFSFFRFHPSSSFALQNNFLSSPPLTLFSALITLSALGAETSVMVLQRRHVCLLLLLSPSVLVFLTCSFLDFVMIPSPLTHCFPLVFFPWLSSFIFTSSSSSFFLYLSFSFLRQLLPSFDLPSLLFFLWLQHYILPVYCHLPLLFFFHYSLILHLWLTSFLNTYF